MQMILCREDAVSLHYLPDSLRQFQRQRRPDALDRPHSAQADNGSSVPTAPIQRRSTSRLRKSPAPPWPLPRATTSPRPIGIGIEICTALGVVLDTISTFDQQLQPKRSTATPAYKVISRWGKWRQWGGGIQIRRAWQLHQVWQSHRAWVCEQRF